MLELELEREMGMANEARTARGERRTEARVKIF
jgi:hypothetical protein